jgi:hypothetical protein
MNKTGQVRDSFGTVHHSDSHGLGDASTGTLHDPARGIARMGAAKDVHSIKIHSGMHPRQVASVNAGGMGQSTLGGVPGANPLAPEPSLKQLHNGTPSPVHPGMVSPSRGRATQAHLKAKDMQHADLSSRVFDEARMKRWK